MCMMQPYNGNRITNHTVALTFILMLSVDGLCIWVWVKYRCVFLPHHTHTHFNIYATSSVKNKHKKRRTNERETERKEERARNSRLNFEFRFVLFSFGWWFWVFVSTVQFCSQYYEWLYVLCVSARRAADFTMHFHPPHSTSHLQLPQWTTLPRMGSSNLKVRITECERW